MLLLFVGVNVKHTLPNREDPDHVDVHPALARSLLLFYASNSPFTRISWLISLRQDPTTSSRITFHDGTTEPLHASSSVRDIMAYSSTHTISHTAESSEPQSTLVHSRNLSTVSSVTLHTNTTLHSQPYEPLLRPITPISGEYYDTRSQPSKETDNLALPRWSQIVSRDQSIAKEKKALSDRRSITPQTRTLARQWAQRILQTILGIWSIYSTVRYLIAFTIYQSIPGQVVSLVLGAATGLSFAFAACGSILTLCQTTLLMNGISVNAVLSIQTTLYYMASCCLLGPGVVNLVLLVLWKKTADIELQTRHRCRLDVDLIWSTTESLCNRRSWSWASWVALSAFRLAVTLVVIAAFHLVASSSRLTPIRRTGKPRYAKSKKSHNRMESCETPLIRTQSALVMSHMNQEPILQRQGSDSMLSSKSSPRNRLRNSRSRGSPISDGHLDLIPNNTPEDFSPINEEEHFEAARDENGFIDRFRTLISQITRETEEGLRFARSDDTSSHRTTESSGKGSPDMDVEDCQRSYHYDAADDVDDDFYSNAAAHTVQPYDYDQNYPADEHVRMMNAYVRRMPTIESMGSREMQSTIGAASWAERDRAANSRPPTRNTLGSWAGSDFGSEPRSRPTSMSAQAELLAGMFGRANATEIGELMRRGDTVRMVGDNGHDQSANDDSSEALGEGVDGYASATTGSKDSKESVTGSYHTAGTGSTRSTTSSMSLRTALADATATPLPLTSAVQPSPLRHTVIREVSES